MNRKYKELIKCINDGKNLEMVLPEYVNEMSNLLYEYSLLQAAMEFYGLKEIVEEQLEQDDDVTVAVNKLLKWVKEVLENEENGEFRDIHIQDIDAMRNEIVHKMDCLTMYADQLQIYEYVLNRKELEYEPAKNDILDETFIERLYQYIFVTKDNVLINQRIQEAVGQLPLRMIKSKFFEYIKESLNCYKDADKSSLDTFIYMLRTSGMVYTPKEEHRYYSMIKERIAFLSKVDFTALSKEDYEECCKVLKETTADITKLSDFNYQAVKVINSMYAFLLLRPYVGTIPSKIQENCLNVIGTTIECLETSNNEALDQKIGELLEELVGVQEQQVEDYQYLSGGLGIIMESMVDSINSMALKDEIACLNLSDTLCGNSLFVELHEEKQQCQVENEYLESQYSDLINDLSILFEKNPQCINRAVMAAILSKLPVFFNNSKEVHEYIENSLSQCHNEAEKSVAKELLLSLMN